MSKAVLISIRPKWCDLIASGKKTIEVRKTAPKIETPFKCYIYCTNGEPNLYKRLCEDDPFLVCTMNGTVIGEFVCDSIFPLSFYASDASFFDTEPPLPVPGTCLTDKEIAEYLGNGKTGYGLHISDLVIYDVPKELSEFRRACHESLYCESCAMWIEQRGCGNAALQITRPPQSWCYVEVLS